MVKTACLRLGLAWCALLLAGAAAAQTWPARAVRIVIPLSPGGTTDVPGRIVAQKLSETLGQQFYVENRAGAGGTIGADNVAKSKPDGYSLLMTATPHVITGSLYKSLPYRTLEDFAPVIRVATAPYVLAVHPSLGVNSVKELVELAKKSPGKIDYASSGNGSAQHLVGALFAHMAGIKLTHVPYKGSAGVQQDLAAGVVKVGFVGTPIVIPHMKSGRLKALAVTTAQRSPSVPELPTVSEAGLAGFEATTWHGVVVPAATPGALVLKLNQDINSALKEKDLSERLAGLGAEVLTGTPRDFADYIAREIPKWSKVVRDSGAKAD